MEMDLASLDSVRNFVEHYKGPVVHLSAQHCFIFFTIFFQTCCELEKSEDVLVHNAAILGTEELVRTAEGFEECLQVNYLSTSEA